MHTKDGDPVEDHWDSDRGAHKLVEKESCIPQRGAIAIVNGINGMKFLFKEE